MEVILLKDVEKLGFSEDVVTVKPGFARNYLIPKGLAVVHNKSNGNILKEKLKLRDKKEAEEMANINSKIEQLKSVNLQVGAKVGSENKIFGSVNAIQISEAFEKQGVVVDRRKITVKEGDIKELGSYTVVVALSKSEDHIVEVPLEIIAE